MDQVGSWAHLMTDDCCFLGASNSTIKSFSIITLRTSFTIPWINVPLNSVSMGRVMKMDRTFKWTNNNSLNVERTLSVHCTPAVFVYLWFINFIWGKKVERISTRVDKKKREIFPRVNAEEPFFVKRSGFFPRNTIMNFLANLRLKGISFRLGFRLSEEPFGMNVTCGNGLPMPDAKRFCFRRLWGKF